ncbi:MAG TPA: hypothetical protein VH105_16555 [Burkholderiales bacterium]|jgi:hypothetical protein|nr:hypothetical protein [Burkholderiales bacterium]
MTEEMRRPQKSVASLLAAAFLIDLVCSFAFYGLCKGYAPRIGWGWFLLIWVAVILVPVFAYLTVKRGSARAALGPFMMFSTPGLLLGMVFPFALL